MVHRPLRFCQFFRVKCSFRAISFAALQIGGNDPLHGFDAHLDGAGGVLSHGHGETRFFPLLIFPGQVRLRVRSIPLAEADTIVRSLEQESH